MYLKALVFYLLTWIAAAEFTDNGKSYIVFPIDGNVYPRGYYSVNITIGQSPEPYVFDMDTGSDLTWLQCDAPCQNCTKGPHEYYKPISENILPVNNPICRALHGSGDSEDDQCDYQVEYADGGSSLGVLVEDTMSLILANGTTVAPQLAIGCGYDQQYNGPSSPYVDGILGLGKGKPGILTQLSKSGMMRNVVGHCLLGGQQGGGYLFFGVPGPVVDLVWREISAQSDHYYLGSAYLLFDGQHTYSDEIDIVFDSGSTYTYFSSDHYSDVLALIDGHFNPGDVSEVEDTNLLKCWKRNSEPFTTIQDTFSYFKTLVLSFPEAVEFKMGPESYLIITENGNACLGILNGTEVGLNHVIVIGDISMQDKLVVYDNEGRRVGWGNRNCTELPAP